MGNPPVVAALLLVRVVVGVTMTAHGYNHWRGGGRIAGTARWFSGLGLKYGVVLLDQPQPDVIRHDHPAGERGDEPAAEPVSGPEAAYPAHMPLPGRQLRIEGITDHNSPDEVGPPVLDAWLRHDIVPDRDDLRRALLAHFTGQLSIATTFRAHPGIGTAQAHHTVSTAVMGIGVSFTRTRRVGRLDPLPPRVQLRRRGHELRPRPGTHAGRAYHRVIHSGCHDPRLRPRRPEGGDPRRIPAVTTGRDPWAARETQRCA
jgi:DoxX-like protein